MKPNTIIEMMKLKLYLGNERKAGNANEAVITQEDMRNIEAGRNVQMGEDPQKRYWKETWIDEVSDLLWYRKLSLHSPQTNDLYQSNNKTLIEYALDYMNQTKCNSDILYHLNFVQIKKGIVFPLEVAGFDGNIRTSCYNDINKKSPIEWKMDKNIEEPITKNQIQI